jgi:hypothetical protein
MCIDSSLVADVILEEFGTDAKCDRTACLPAP